MKNVHILSSVFLAAALVAAGAVTSCTNEDNAVVENLSDNEILFTATLAPKGNNTRSVDADGHTKWVTGEQIAIYYQTTESENSFATAIADVTANGDGSATISATLTDAKDGGAVSFVYPASLHNGAGDINETALLTTQNGRLNDGSKNISKNFDAATTSGTLVVNSEGATVGGTVALQNRVCICKFSFSKKIDEYNTQSITALQKVTIDIDGKTYDVALSTYNSNQCFYLAMLPATDATALINAYNNGSGPLGGPITYSETYSAIANNVTLAAGTFYTNTSIVLSVTQTIITGSRTSTVTVPAGEVLVLKNANIEVSSGPGIECKGDASIILYGTNSVNAAKHSAGIQIGPGGITLTISGSGSLTVMGGEDGGAGIGTEYGGVSGNIAITGGTITATGGNNAAGIGAGWIGRLENITISGTNTHINATKGDNAPYSIGLGGDWNDGNSSCGTITIGGTVYYNGSSFENGGESYLAQIPFYWQWPTTTP